MNQGALLKGNTDTNSIFEEVMEDNGDFNFLENALISKMVKYLSCFYDHVKGYMNDKKYSKIGLEIEEGTDDMLICSDKKLISILLEILADLGLSNLLSLIFSKYKIKYPVEKVIIGKVKDYSLIWNYKFSGNKKSRVPYSR